LNALFHQTLRHRLRNRVRKGRQHRTLGVGLLCRSDETPLGPIPGRLVTGIFSRVIQQAQRDVETFRQEGCKIGGHLILVIPVEHLEIEWIGGHHPLVQHRAKSLTHLFGERGHRQARAHRIGEKDEITARSAHRADPATF